MCDSTFLDVSTCLALMITGTICCLVDVLSPLGISESHLTAFVPPERLQEWQWEEPLESTGQEESAHTPTSGAVGCYVKIFCADVDRA